MQIDIQINDGAKRATFTDASIDGLCRAVHLLHWPYFDGSHKQRVVISHDRGDITISSKYDHRLNFGWITLITFTFNSLGEIMWPFSRSPWSKVEKQISLWLKKRNWEAEMKEFWPCTKTGDEYLDYLAFRSTCPYHILAAFTCVNDSRAYRKELAYWLAIMRSSSCSTNGSGSKR